MKKDLGVGDLLTLIERYNLVLNAKRNPGFLNNLYSPTSRTETMLKPFKAYLEKLREERQEENKKSNESPWDRF